MDHRLPEHMTAYFGVVVTAASHRSISLLWLRSIATHHLCCSIYRQGHQQQHFWSCSWCLIYRRGRGTSRRGPMLSNLFHFLKGGQPLYCFAFKLLLKLRSHPVYCLHEESPLLSWRTSFCPLAYSSAQWSRNFSLAHWASDSPPLYFRTICWDRSVTVIGCSHTTPDGIELLLTRWWCHVLHCSVMATIV